jgi:hypothetical protein
MKQILLAIFFVLLLTSISCSGKDNDALISETLENNDFTPLFDTNTQSLSILFVGNSYLAHRPYVDGHQTRFSVYQQIVDLIAISIPNIQHRLRSIGGGTLEEHWKVGFTEGTPRYDITTGNYDLLVIQGRYDILQSERNKDRFDKYADLFAKLALENNTKVVFYGLWATDNWINPDSGDTFNQEANNIYCSAAIRNAVSCAPNGIAHGMLYDALSKTMSEVEVEELLTVDRVHPYPPLAYMAATVVYQVIFGSEPPNLSTYAPPSLTSELGALIRSVANKAVRTHALNMHIPTQ